MWFHSLLASWKSGRSSSRRSCPRPAQRRTRLALEQLEDRLVPANYSAANVTQLIADIGAANAAGGANTIALTAPTTSPYVLTAVNNVPTGLANDALNGGADGLPLIAAKDNLTILGNGDTIERSAASGTPQFRLLAVAYSASLTLANLTLQNGVSTSAAYGGHGGAIDNAGALTLSGVTVLNNQADFGSSGGLGVYAFGGAVYSVGSLTMENGTLLESNETWGANGCGGAVCVAGGTADIANTTFTGNTAEGYGGGDGRGGAIYVGGVTALPRPIML
jgi:fibronectin-binding autotransporter adhesin